MSAQTLKPLSSLTLSREESTIVKWLRSATWEPVSGAREPTVKARVPEFFGGVRLYNMQSGGTSSQGPLEFLIKKLALQGAIGKQELYPVAGHGTQPRYLALKKADIDHLKADEEEE